MEKLPTTITETHKGLTAGLFSVRDLVETSLRIIKEKDGEVHAFLEIFSDLNEQIAYAEELFKLGKATELTGVPIALKDNICFKGHHVSAASKILEGYVATYDADVVESLRAQGAVIIGRTNMDEFAMGSSTENSAFGVTKNPHDLNRVAGGTSGGSAAAVAMGATVVAIGSDTGGSIRQPAGFCGVVGLKPTYGSISRHGLIAYVSSFDVIGPFANSVTDAEIVFKTLAKSDERDATSLRESERIQKDSRVKKIGVPRAFIDIDGLDQETRANFEKSLEKLESLGYEVVDISVPLMEYSLSVYYILMPAEASTNLARFDGIRFGLSKSHATPDASYKATRTEGFGDEVKLRILLGTYVLSHGYYDAYYGKASELREAMRRGIKDIFTSVDVIATPTSPTPAFNIGSKKDPLEMYLADIFTVLANIVGIPGISLPAGKTKTGLPLDIQFMADHNAESKLFALGKHFLGEV